VGRHGLKYRPREPYQTTYIDPHDATYCVDCPTCDAPAGLDCMSVNPRKPDSELRSVPVHAHEERRVIAAHRVVRFPRRPTFRRLRSWPYPNQRRLLF
jgi:hypothetical protein